MDDSLQQPPLVGDPAREAIGAMSGFDYQILRTLLEWVRLPHGDRLYVEGAEDLDLHAHERATAEQIKSRRAPVTLASASVLQSLVNFWEHQRRNPGHRVHFAFVTTAPRRREKGKPFGDVSGLDFWDRCRDEGSDLRPLRSFLLARLAELARAGDAAAKRHGSGPGAAQVGALDDLIAFLEAADDGELRERLVARVVWATEQPRSTEIKEMVESELVAYGEARGLHTSESERVLDALYQHVWSLVRDGAGERALERKDWQRIFETVTTVQVSFADVREKFAAATPPGRAGAGSSPGAFAPPEQDGRTVRLRPRCLVLASTPAEPEIEDAVTRAVEGAGLDVVHEVDPSRSRLRQAIDRSVIAIGVGGAARRDLIVAARTRPSLLISTGGSRGRARAAADGDLARLVHDGSRRKVEERVSVWLREALGELGASIGRAGRAAAETGTPIPQDLFSLPLEVSERTETVTKPASAEALFAASLPAVDRGRRAVITGVPGSGKSVLVTQYCRWLRESGRGPGALPPVAVVLRAHHLEQLVKSTSGAGQPGVTGETLLAMVSARVKESAAAPADRTRLRSLLRPLRESGRLHLMLDGLDEFGSRNAAHLRDVLDAAGEAAALGTNVTIACRANFWDAQVRDAFATDARVRLREIGADEARHLLVDVPLPREARWRGEIAPWLRNPLLIRFLRLLRQGEDAAALFRSVRNRTAVYRAWSEWVSAEARKVRVERLAEACGEVALIFTEQRLFQVDAGTVVKRINDFQVPNGRLASLAALDALEVFERAPEPDGGSRRLGAIKFQHETILEYFATARLCDDFTAALRTDRPLTDLRLAAMPLDYFQSSVYGFFDEMLEPLGYRAQLVERLSRRDPPGLPPHLLRNLVEYLGLTARDGAESGLARLLVAMIEDPREMIDDPAQSTLIRYNAARALERIHAQAPRPYFEYVSDWGTRDFSAFKARQITDRARAPWAVRGWKARAPACQPYVTFTPNDPALPMDHALQEEVSDRLLAVLEKLFDASVPAEEPVRVNVSLALVRWLHASGLERARALAARCRSAGIEKATGINLGRAIQRLSAG